MWYEKYMMSCDMKIQRAQQAQQIWISTEKVGIITFWMSIEKVDLSKLSIFEWVLKCLSSAFLKEELFERINKCMLRQHFWMLVSIFEWVLKKWTSASSAILNSLYFPTFCKHIWLQNFFTFLIVYLVFMSKWHFGC